MTLPGDAKQAPAELTDEDVCRYLGRKARGKLELVLVHASMYRREPDGVWRLLPGLSED